MNSPTTETVSADARSARQDQNRDAQARWRARRRLRLVTRRVVLESEWLDTLEERGYLDPDDRGDGPAEARRHRVLHYGVPAVIQATLN